MVPTAEAFRPRKRLRNDPQPRDKFNLSNDNFYEVSKTGAHHRVRQTFGQLVVEHAYPAQKLQLPFVCSSNPVRETLTNFPDSSKHGLQNKKLVPSTVLPFSFHPTSNCASAKSELRRKRKTRRGGRSEKAETWAKGCTRLPI